MAGSCESEATQIKEQGSPESPSQEQHIPSLSIKPRSEKEEDQRELKSSQTVCLVAAEKEIGASFFLRGTKSSDDGCFCSTRQLRRQ